MTITHIKVTFIYNKYFTLNELFYETKFVYICGE